MNELPVPQPGDAEAIARGYAGEPVVRVQRFPLGLAHWVYDVELASGRKLVVRIGRAGSERIFDAAERWSARLRPLGVPLPELFASGRHGDLPYLVLQRLPGADLGEVYTGLSPEQKRALAERIADVQARVGALPPGRGFGYALDPEAPFAHATWASLLGAALGRARRRIARAGLVPGDPVGAVERAAARLAPYLEAVAPRAFLDDTTTKNVIVDRGRLSGIVDVDVVCYGDPLFPLALTRTALLNAGHAPDYAEHWQAQLGLDRERERALHLYTGLFCAEFLSEAGQRFNRGEPVGLEPARGARLLEGLERELARV